MATIKEIASILEDISDLTDKRLEIFAQDDRQGVQRLLSKKKRELQAVIEENIRLEWMLRYEREQYNLGYQLIAGIDEVGRGPLAGPVVATAVILPKDCKIKGLNDSKKIPKKKHEELYEEIKQKAMAVGVGIVDNKRIDQINIYEATKQAMIEAINDLNLQPDHLLIDAMKLDIAIPQTSIIKGDANSLSIAAASIVAKVTRDRLMTEYDSVYTGYYFEKNAGYGTKEHLSALEKLGVTPIHRESFEPIKSMLKSR